MNLQHEQPARTYSMNMLQGHSAWTCSKEKQHRQAAGTCSIDMHPWTRSKDEKHERTACSIDIPYEHAARTCSRDFQHRHSASTCCTCTDVQHEEPVWSSSIDMQLGHTTLICTLDMQQICTYRVQQRHAVWILHDGHASRTCSMDIAR